MPGGSQSHSASTFQASLRSGTRPDAHPQHLVRQSKILPRDGRDTPGAGWHPGAFSGAPYKSMFQNGIFFISYWYLFGLIYHCRQPDFFAQLKNKVSLIIAKRAICRHAKDLR
jgi:hypothetical protein